MASARGSAARAEGALALSFRSLPFVVLPHLVREERVSRFERPRGEVLGVVAAHWPPPSASSSRKVEAAAFTHSTTRLRW